MSPQALLNLVTGVRLSATLPSRWQSHSRKFFSSRAALPSLGLQRPPCLSPLLCAQLQAVARHIGTAVEVPWHSDGLLKFADNSRVCFVWKPAQRSSLTTPFAGSGLWWCSLLSLTAPASPPQGFCSAHYPKHFPPPQCIGMCACAEADTDGLLCPLCRAVDDKRHQILQCPPLITSANLGSHTSVKPLHVPLIGCTAHMEPSLQTDRSLA